MCGIFAYLGNKNAVPLILHGLEKLEYRGYDSAWIVAFGPESELYVRQVGKVSELVVKTEKELALQWNTNYHIGMGHSRRATHGGVTEANTHPHHDCSGRYYVCHNGIIENYHKLKAELQKEGYIFYSETDTEVIAALLWKYRSNNFLETVEQVIALLVGAYGLIIVDKEHPNQMIGFRRWSPLIFAKWIDGGMNEFYFSSDIQSLSGLANEYIYLEDGELVYIRGNEYHIRSQSQVINKSFEILQLAEQDNEKGWFDHFMLKEIYEQPAVIKRIVKWRINFDTGELDADALDYIKKMDIEKIIIIWCGTSYMAWLLWAKWINMRSGIDVQVKIASEVLYEHVDISDTTLFIFPSQSGETADSMEVIKYLKSKWAHILGIVNVVWSSISRLADAGMFTRCGYEIGVASTKAFIGQAMSFLIIALYLWLEHNLIYQEYRSILKALQNIPIQIDALLTHTKPIKDLAKELAWFKNMFYLGRGIHSPIAAEWSLKMKEISYIHSEAYAAGELKHGSLALITKDFLSIILAPEDSYYEQNISTINEVKARDGVVVALGTKDVEKADRTIIIPKTHDALYPLLEVVVMQLLAYYTALDLWREIDKPRNLAKSVTVK